MTEGEEFGNGLIAGEMRCGAGTFKGTRSAPEDLDLRDRLFYRPDEIELRKCRGQVLTHVAIEMMNRKRVIPLLLMAFLLCSCEDPHELGSETSRKLNETGEIAVEIGQACQLEAHPYYRLEDDLARVEVELEDPGFDHEAAATEVTKLKSVQSFQGPLHLIFVYRGNQPETEAPKLWVRYDARNGTLLEE